MYCQSVQYRIKIPSVGWSDWMDSSRKMNDDGWKGGFSQIEIAYSGSGTVSYRSCVEGEGWTDGYGNGEQRDDIIQKGRITAISLSIRDAPGYHLFYRVKNNVGQVSDWKRDGTIAGNKDGTSFITDFEIKMVMDEPHLLYRSYMQNTGWTNLVGDNQISGTTGAGLSMEAFYVQYSGPGRLTMQSCVEKRGWLEEVPNGVVCGTERRGLRMESFRMYLHDLDNYHISYCVCIKGLGWQSWVKDGENAGIEGSRQVIEAIRMRISM